MFVFVFLMYFLQGFYYGDLLACSMYVLCYGLCATGWVMCCCCCDGMPDVLSVVTATVKAFKAQLLSPKQISLKVYCIILL